MNTPAEIAKVFEELGVKKTQTPKGRLFLLAVLAGMFIALAGVGSTIANVNAGKMAGACVFPTGLAMVILAGSELFTGDNLMIVSFLQKRITLGKMAAVLLIVYIGNLIGGLLVAAVAAGAGTLDAVADAAAATASAKMALRFDQALLRGFACNVLVCIAVWMAAAAKEPAGKVLGLFLPIMLFVLCGYEHCVADMYYIPAGWFVGMRGAAATTGGIGAFLFRCLLPVTIGNMIGGMGVGAVYWAIYLKKSKS